MRRLQKSEVGSDRKYLKIGDTRLLESMCKKSLEDEGFFKKLYGK